MSNPLAKKPPVRTRDFKNLIAKKVQLIEPSQTLAIQAKVNAMNAERAKERQANKTQSPEHS